jgi:hypothetical protein
MCIHLLFQPTINSNVYEQMDEQFCFLYLAGVNDLALL